MGESEKANNMGNNYYFSGVTIKYKYIGVPSSPRDGCNIEIIGLVKSTMRWLGELSDKGIIDFNGVQLPNNKSTFTFKEWEQKIQGKLKIPMKILIIVIEHFEAFFWIPVDSSEDSNYRVNNKLVHRRGIYKDVVGSTDEWSDYQFRPNIPIAMAVVCIFLYYY